MCRYNYLLMKGFCMKKMKNIWLNGFFRAWEMLYCFPLEDRCPDFLKIDTANCKGVHVMSGFLTASFAFGLFFVILSWILTSVFGIVPGAIAGALAMTAILLWCDHCAGVTLVANMLAKKFKGAKMGDILLEQNSDPERINSGIGSAIFSVLILLKAVFFYFIIQSQNFYLLILIMLAGAFTQAYALNAHTGKAAFFGFANSSERNIFYLTAILLLLLGSKFNMMISLAFLGGIFLWNYWIKESFIKLAYGKSDESITFYGECAIMIASLIALIYSAGAFQA